MNSIQHYSIKAILFRDEWRLLSHFVLPKFCAPDYKYHILGYKPDSHRLLLPRLSLDKSLPIFTVFYRYRKTLSFIQSLSSGAEKTGY